MTGKIGIVFLPYIMFAIREVPQMSTGFSPFELLYGRQPRGILDVIREVWEERPAAGENLVGYILKIEKKLAKLKNIVAENLTTAQETQKKNYKWQGSYQRIHCRKKVIVLLPSHKHKFIAKWQGPFHIIETLNEVNYKVFQPGKRKPYQIWCDKNYFKKRGG